MVDFTSTQQGMDIDTRRGARLMAAIIAQALRDLTIPVTAAERKRRANLDTDARESVEFFYNKSSPFKTYAHFVGIDPKSFVYNLEQRARSRNIAGEKKPFLTNRELRIIRIRILWHKTRELQNKKLG